MPHDYVREIKDLMDGVDSADGMAEQMRSLSAQKLDEVEALLEQTKAMKGWLEVAKECGCATPAECALFDARGEEGGEFRLALVRVDGKDCRRG
jgi:pyridoxal biosynthesis lyase PdxS